MTARALLLLLLLSGCARNMPEPLLPCPDLPAFAYDQEEWRCWIVPEMEIECACPPDGPQNDPVLPEPTKEERR